MKTFLIMAVAVLALNATALAQQEEVIPAPEAMPAPQAQAEEAVEYSYGSVVNISPTEIVVSEYDYDTGAETNATYNIDVNVMLKNVASIAEIAPGDYVEIDYVIKNGAKVATVIYVEKEPAPGTEPQATTEIPEWEPETIEEDVETLPEE